MIYLYRQLHARICYIIHLKTSHIHTANNDEIEDKTITSMWDEVYLDPIQVPIGPITRARAKKFKEAFNRLIQAT